jgi:hypothetical protein
MKYILLASTLLFVLTGCSSKAKFAEMVNCTESEAKFNMKNESPLHANYIIECKNQKFTCFNSLVYSKCEEYKEVKK